MGIIPVIDGATSLHLFLTHFEVLIIPVVDGATSLHHLLTRFEVLIIPVIDGATSLRLQGGGSNFRMPWSPGRVHFLWSDVVPQAGQRNGSRCGPASRLNPFVGSSMWCGGRQEQI